MHLINRNRQDMKERKSNMEDKRIFLIVLDSYGVGNAPDA